MEIRRRSNSTRSAVLISAIALMVVVGVLGAGLLASITSRTQSRMDRVARVRAAATALAAEQAALWKISNSSRLKADLAAAVAAGDTSFNEAPLITFEIAISGGTGDVSVWPGADVLRVRTVGRIGGCFAERWTELPISMK